MISGTGQSTTLDYSSLRYDQRTIAYMARRQAEGLSKKDVLRCLKRFIAREVFHDLVIDLGQKGGLPA